MRGLYKKRAPGDAGDALPFYNIKRIYAASSPALWFMFGASISPWHRNRHDCSRSIIKGVRGGRTSSDGLLEFVEKFGPVFQRRPRGDFLMTKCDFEAREAQPHFWAPKWLVLGCLFWDSFPQPFLEKGLVQFTS